jgi:H+-transporting ATPase
MQPVVKPIPETEPKPDAGDKPKTDLTPQIATRAYELYERQGRRDGESVQNWDRAEQEIRENQARTEPKSESKSVVKVQLDPEAKPSPIPDTNIKAATGIKPAPEAKAEPQTESQAGVPTKSNTEPKPETKAKPPGDVSPQLIERVHKL